MSERVKTGDSGLGLQVSITLMLHEGKVPFLFGYSHASESSHGLVAVFPPVLPRVVLAACSIAAEQICISSPVSSWDGHQAPLAILVNVERD